MDWRIYKAIYDVSLHHHWLGTFFSDVEKASIPFMVIATAALWLLDRPGGPRKWKLAAGNALTSAAVAVFRMRTTPVSGSTSTSAAPTQTSQKTGPSA